MWTWCDWLGPNTPAGINSLDSWSDKFSSEETVSVPSPLRSCCLSVDCFPLTLSQQGEKWASHLAAKLKKSPFVSFRIPGEYETSSAERYYSTSLCRLLRLTFSQIIRAASHGLSLKANKRQSSFSDRRRVQQYVPDAALGFLHHISTIPAGFTWVVAHWHVCNSFPIAFLLWSLVLIHFCTTSSSPNAAISRLDTWAPKYHF